MVALRWVSLLSLTLVLVGCPKKDDSQGKVPFGLGDKSTSTAKTTEVSAKKKDASKEASVKDAGKAKDAGADAGDAKVPLTPEQQFRETLLLSLRYGKLDPSLNAEPLKNAEKVGDFALRGVVPPVSLSRLSYETTGNQLVVRGGQGGVYRLADKAFVAPEQAPPSVVPATVTDRSGAHVIVETKVSCEGVRLVVAKREEIVAGVLAGKPVAKPWLRPNPEPTKCNKADLTPQVFEVLGWTGQGIVFFLDGEFFVQEAPLSSDAVPRKLEFSSGLPAPLPSGLASSDGRTVLVPTKFGLLVYSAGAQPRLLTHGSIDANSALAFTSRDGMLTVYWTHADALYQAVIR